MSVSRLQRKGVNVTQKNIPVNIGTSGGNLQIQYLGAGGLYIRHEGQAFAIDPFFSNQHFYTIGKSLLLGGKIKSKQKFISYGKTRMLDSLNVTDTMLRGETKMIFAAHGHYDHLMDIPFIHQHWFGGNPDVYVNNSSANTVANVIPAQKLHDIESILSVRNQIGSSIDLPSSNGSTIKIYPILAAHNPHDKHIKLFSGGVMYPISYYKKPEDKTHIQDWLEGRTLSFLIDIERNSKIEFRMFVQSSSCQFPDGLPPENLLKMKPIDLAILGVASYHFSESSYPCAYLEKVKPSRVMFVHWEDFFRSYKRKPKSLMKNDIPRFFKTILPKCQDDYILPVPGVVVDVRY